MATYPPHGQDPWDLDLKAYIDDSDDDHQAAAVVEATDSGTIDGVVSSLIEGGTSSTYNEIVALIQGGETFYEPEAYGAVGDGATDDTVALQNCIDAAHADGGGIVLLRHQYAWTGDLIHRGAVTVMGVGTRWNSTSQPDPDNGLIALDATSRYRYGYWASPSSLDDNPGPLTNTFINGADVGGATELVRMNCVDGKIEGVHISHSAGKGLEVAGSQNSIIDGCNITFHASTALSFHEPTGQGAGNVKVNDCYVGSSDLLLKTDSDPVNFPPHDCFITGTLFEQYNEDGNLFHINAGELQFRSCVLTYSLGSGAPSNDCMVLVENQAIPTVSTIVTFDGCYFNGGGGGGVAHAIRSVLDGSVANRVWVYGRTHYNNADYLIGADGGTLIASVEGPVFTGINTIGKFNAINGGDNLNFYTRRFNPIRFDVEDGLLEPIKIRRETDVYDRINVNRDGDISWFDGSGGILQGRIQYDSASDQMLMEQKWRFHNGFVRRAATQTINTDSAVIIDAADASAHDIALSATGVDITSMTVNNPAQGMELRIGIASTGTHSVTWATNMRFVGGSAPSIPASQAWTFVEFTYRGSLWIETNRSVNVPST